MIRQRRGRQAWAAVGLTALALLVSVGLRSAPGVLIVPIEQDLGWDRAALATAAAVGLLLYGLAGPFTGHLAATIGPRRVMLAGLALMSIATAAGAAMTAVWQVPLLWGLLSGLGTGLVAPVLGVTVATRWFTDRRGLVLGLLGATSSAGQLAFVPALMALAVTVGWRISSLLLAGLALLVIVPIWRFLRDGPDEGERSAADPGGADGAATVLRQAVRARAFWLLAGSFAICGATSNGLVSTHLIAHTTDHGLSHMAAAGVLAIMGGMNLVGTVGSGWLADRFDARRLLALYLVGRGLTLVLLPAMTDPFGLTLFAVLFGLDYYATVPPTQVLTATLFGRRHAGLLFGWIFVAHQVGAASGALLGGLAHDLVGDYTPAFMVAAALLMVGALLALRVPPGLSRRPGRRPAPTWPGGR
jgi:predicted MFS family arabinose efflux permease